MTELLKVFPARRQSLAAGCVAAALVTAGCSTVLEGAQSDYRTQVSKTAPLDVPPDLTQLAREGRIRTPGEAVSASAGAAGAAASASAPAPAPSASVAVAAVGDVRVERDGQQRWLVVARPPEVLWPLVRAFWAEAGFKLTVDNAQTGVLETDWAEDRSKIPKDFIRSTIGRIFDGLYDSGARDRYRTRLERTPTGTEIYVSHRRMEEVYTSQRDSTRWQTAASDPQLEAEFLSRLMARITQQAEPAARDRVALSQAGPAPSVAPAVGAEGRLLLEDGFDRAWRRVGLALDRSGFSVEDRDRAAGLFFVRYIDPAAAGKEEPNLFAKLFRGERPTGITRYRVQVKAEGAGSSVALQDAEGKPQTGDAARLILARLAESLR